jgi:hypothetical protein
MSCFGPSGGAVATFDPAAFIAAYPAFATVSPASLGVAFTLATLYWRNDGTGPIPDVPTQTTLLWLLTAHIAQLNYGINGQPPTGLVGRINSAGEGSVNVGTDYVSNINSAWFDQTTFGAEFWTATAAFRTMRYRSRPGRYFGAFYPSGRG